MPAEGNCPQALFSRERYREVLRRAGGDRWRRSCQDPCRYLEGAGRVCCSLANQRSRWTRWRAPQRPPPA